MNEKFTKNNLKKIVDIPSPREEKTSYNYKILHSNNNQYNVAQISDTNNSNNIKSEVINQFLYDLDNKFQNKHKNLIEDLDDNNNEGEDEFEKAEREYHNKKNFKHTNEKNSQNNFNNNNNKVCSKIESPSKLKIAKVNNLFSTNKILSIPTFTKHKDFQPKLIAYPGVIYLNASLKKGACTFRKKINSKNLNINKQKSNNSSLFIDYNINQKYLSKNLSNISSFSNNDNGNNNNKNLQYISEYKLKKKSFNNVINKLCKMNSNDLIIKEINNKKVLKSNKHSSSSIDIRSNKNNSKYDGFLFNFKSKKNSPRHCKNDSETNLSNLDAMKNYFKTKNKKPNSLLNANNNFNEILKYFSNNNSTTSKYNPYSTSRRGNSYASKYLKRNNYNNRFPYIHS